MRASRARFAEVIYRQPQPYPAPVKLACGRGIRAVILAPAKRVLERDIEHVLGGWENEVANSYDDAPTTAAR
jgi:hypothetical protein